MEITDTVEDVNVEVRDLLHRYKDDDLWKLLESEWRSVESQVAPVRGSKEELRQYIEGVVEKFRQRLRTNQGIVPSTMSALTGYILGQLEGQYPVIAQVKIIVSLVVALVVYSLQDQFLFSDINGKETPPSKEK